MYQAKNLEFETFRIDTTIKYCYIICTRTVYTIYVSSFADSFESEQCYTNNSNPTNRY